MGIGSLEIVIILLVLVVIGVFVIGAIAGAIMLIPIYLGRKRNCRAKSHYRKHDQSRS